MEYTSTDSVCFPLREDIAQELGHAAQRDEQSIYHTVTAGIERLGVNLSSLISTEGLTAEYPWGFEWYRIFISCLRHPTNKTLLIHTND